MVVLSKAATEGRETDYEMEKAGSAPPLSSAEATCEEINSRIPPTKLQKQYKKYYLYKTSLLRIF